ncbi:signal recognition particle protein [bacterium BMS3Abin01]|nr:signal recognition particle protein [bacterium BMS3Abin01]
MFDTLSDKLTNVLDNLKGQGSLTEDDINKAMREIRLALLEADVNFKVVKQFVATVKERALGEDVLESITPGQQVVKIVHEELSSLMGSASTKLTFSPRPPTVVLMVGLQGSGKTTACAKLARHLLKQGKSPTMVAADIYRPAAVQQLKTLGEQLKVPVFSIEGSEDAVEIARRGVEEAAATGRDVTIIDTAGRLHIDEKLMAELVDIRARVKPHNILLVLDSMAGQDAVNVAEEFQQQVDFDGVILTKLDGDARGGAALSVRAVTGKPIKFASNGEKLNSFDYFHPDRMASRILGMGDVLTLIERAQDTMDEKKTRELEERLRKAQFTFNDFLDQMRNMRKMGPLTGMLAMIPGIPKQLKQTQIDERELDKVEAIICSMTYGERQSPEIINGSRRRRIAAGSGTNVQAVNQLISRFKQMQKLMKQMSSGKKMGNIPPEMLRGGF